MRKKILVLDDKIAIAKVLSIYLASDYDCIWLPNGIEGVKWVSGFSWLVSFLLSV